MRRVVLALVALSLFGCDPNTLEAPKGDTGATGAAGPAGAPGAEGAAGPQGATGTAGEAGPQGATGATGAAGPQGATGAAGPQGDTGATGAAGTAGLSTLVATHVLVADPDACVSGGVLVEVGLDANRNGTLDDGEEDAAQTRRVCNGLQGAVGATGAQGAIGLTGAQGDTGAQGPQGIAGLKGDTGAQGIAGLKGDTGAQGIAGLKGDTGAQGDTGAVGPMGPQGLVGLTGPQGDTGAVGAQGLVGFSSLVETNEVLMSTARCPAGSVQVVAGVDVDGDGALQPGEVRNTTEVCNGAQGAQGVAGVMGPAGPAGAAGDSGAIGPQGPQGIAGLQGDTGMQGPQGIKGDTGAQGPIGPQGPAGTVSAGKAPYRWAVFNTWDESQGSWAFGDDASLFGGINPSLWSQGAGDASNINRSPESLRALFTQQGRAGANAMVVSRSHVSTDNGYYSNCYDCDVQVVTVLFRVKNTTQTLRYWTPCVSFTADGNRGNQASAALNGVNQWSYPWPSNACVGMSLPPNRTSTLIFVAPSGQPMDYGNGIRTRSLRLAFTGNSLTLPAGLEFVDDLDTSTSF